MSLLQVENLRIAYRGAPEPTVKGVTLEIQEGERVALVGESGSGKSTFVRALLGLTPITGGTLRWQGETRTPAEMDGAYRRRVQMIFQDPYNSLHPRMTVLQNLCEPLKIHGLYKSAESPRRVAEMVERVGLDPGSLHRKPHEFSGGQLQRLGIARALLPEPRLLLADEPVSALDVSVQAQILNLLYDLSEELGLAVLMISHDLAVVHQLCHRVAVMFGGRLVEVGTAHQVCFESGHPYTLSLVRATAGKPVEQPSAATPQGVQSCPYFSRCPRRQQRCEQEFPPLVENTPGHVSACFFSGSSKQGVG